MFERKYSELKVRPYNNRDTVEEYRMVLYRFCEQDNFHLSDIQLLSIVEDSVPAMAIALTSHHSTRYNRIQGYVALMSKPIRIRLD